MKLFGEGGFKGFLAYHGEKILFLGAMVAAVMMVLNGFGKRQALETSETPTSLRTKVQDTERHIDSFKWTADFEKDRDLDQEFRKRAEETLQPISIESYAIKQHLRPPVSPPPGRRDDPELLAATDLQVRGGYGALSKQKFSRELGAPGGGQDRSIFENVQIQSDDVADDENARPIKNGRGGGGGFGARRTFGANDKPDGVYFVAVTGLVPMRQQFARYQTALANAGGFDPQRDVPTIFDWELERAIVEGNEQPPKWETVATLSRILEDKAGPGMASYRNASAEDTDNFDPRFRDSNLTMSVPNLSTRNIGELVIHDKIVELTAVLKAKEAAEAAEEANKPNNPRRPRRGQQDPRMSGDPYGADFGAQFEGGEFGPPMDMMRGSPRGGGQNRFAQRGASDLSGDMAIEDVPEYKMFRYVDLDVTPGTAYVYRLKLVWDDPNKPMLSSAPIIDSLEPAVQIRVTSVDRDKEGRATDFSEPSDEVRVREGSIMLVGNVAAADESVIRTDKGQSIRIRGPYKEPVATVMAMEFDQDRASDIPIERMVRRGTVGNFTADEVWVPVFWQGQLWRQEKYKFEMDNLVVDIAGGVPADPSVLIKEDRSRPRPEAYVDLLRAPGMLLVREASGNLRIRREIDDKDAFDEISAAIEEEEDVEESPEGRFGPPAEFGPPPGDE